MIYQKEKPKNCLWQWKLVYAFILCPQKKFGILIHHNKSSSQHELQVCKQQQTALGNKLVSGVCASNLWVLISTKLGTLRYYGKSLSKMINSFKL